MECAPSPEKGLTHLQDGRVIPGGRVLRTVGAWGGGFWNRGYRAGQGRAGLWAGKGPRGAGGTVGTTDETGSSLPLGPWVPSTCSTAPLWMPVMISLLVQDVSSPLPSIVSAGPRQPVQSARW